MGVRTADVRDGNIGETLEGLAAVIHERAGSALPDTSYTAFLLAPEKGDKLLSKLAEESSEVIMACKDGDHDHIRYEMADLLYHMLVVAEKHGITLDELAGELDARRK
ncbi:MAG: phosphoribosyl-ATP diphosphatase [Coriobacteriaceae bacterium]|nr:phosphoribosyl-ATP diphosphatase [Tractidigestivibacter sp.]MCI6273766.1 phosphoribosyl-ATP diphosphatase [Coriobacteriaceae bacterium]MCI6844113.1 phosphoribosyl-ATP diphosphatase [Coriobacteriaceae bacterium]MCI7438906.1 phosphoribosyl-ATP diphosphatase [Coriobacteriaceae bacterium]MDD7584111.1 phosphoribosyl-ATP diphosphatase [Coriobacteriaceae bacterium]MDY4534964.1 phosphoribosyl-ATP diphosphatase [Tractidigestivibacter sp.]